MTLAVVVVAPGVSDYKTKQKERGVGGKMMLSQLFRLWRYMYAWWYQHSWGVTLSIKNKSQEN
jgi:hypothetical protein